MLEKVTMQRTQQFSAFVTERTRHSGKMTAHAGLFSRMSLRAGVRMDARGIERGIVFSEF